MRANRTYFETAPARRGPRGMTLIEIMVAVALLSVIMLGLTAMFSQTRKAFTLGLGNVEYQEAGRAAMELITREVQQTTPTDYSLVTNVVNNEALTGTGLNFYVKPSEGEDPTKIVQWPLTGTDVTSFSFNDLFFVTRYNQQWKAIGYRVSASDAATNIGTLYRYEVDDVSLNNLLITTATLGSSLCPVTADFTSEPPSANTNCGRVIDNVVDFRVRMYDKFGELIYYPPSPPNANYGSNPGDTIFTARLPNGDIEAIFSSNAVPAYVEIELGILETPTAQRLQTQTNSPTQFLSYLTSHAAEVHIFRQRVAIPAVDPSTYPTE